MSRFGLQKLILLFLPVVCLFYIGLFATMAWWYPAGLDTTIWNDHVFNFTIVYLFWLIVFFSYRLFDWDALRTPQSIAGRIGMSFIACLIIAVLFFYFQPALLITPRRFLLSHVVITGLGILLWYLFIMRVANVLFKLPVYSHSSLTSNENIHSLVKKHSFLGLHYSGVVHNEIPSGSLVVIPSFSYISEAHAKELFALRNKRIQFVEYTELYERLTRTIYLSELTELWFISFINYRKRPFFIIVKTIIDIIVATCAAIIFILTFPIFAVLIKMTSPGPLFFKQRRVGYLGQTFILYKYRTMVSSSANNTWTTKGDARITSIGKFLRALRIDELPQCWNILKGDMSIVGPRPEQVHIVQELNEEIPYYAERHVVKPGLTGWAQLHVYASTLEETKRKLQYDLYYIKHRSIIFDIEIIVKTFYNLITFSGR